MKLMETWEARLYFDSDESAQDDYTVLNKWNLG